MIKASDFSDEDLRMMSSPPWLLIGANFLDRQIARWKMLLLYVGITYLVFRLVPTFFLPCIVLLPYFVCNAIYIDYNNALEYINSIISERNKRFVK
jgi:hypothetical protein